MLFILYVIIIIIINSNRSLLKSDDELYSQTGVASRALPIPKITPMLRNVFSYIYTRRYYLLGLISV